MPSPSSLRRPTLQRGSLRLRALGIPPSLPRSQAPDQGAFALASGVEPTTLRNIIRGAEFRVTRLLSRERREPAQWTGALLVSIHREVFGRSFQGPGLEESEMDEVSFVGDCKK